MEVTKNLLDLKQAVTYYGKESNTERKIDHSITDLELPIQLNLENHRYVFESAQGSFIVSPINVVITETQREYLDHYTGKKYCISPIDEAIKNVVDCGPIQDNQISLAIKQLGNSLKDKARDAKKKDCHFFSGVCLTQLFTEKIV